MQDALAEIDELGAAGDAPLAEIAASMGITLEQLLGAPPSATGPSAAAGASGAAPSLEARSMATAAPTAADNDSEPPAKRARRSSAGHGSQGSAEPGGGAAPAAGAALAGAAARGGACEGGKRTRARRSTSLEAAADTTAVAVKQEEQDAAAADGAGRLEDGRAGCLKREVKDLLAREKEQAELKREMERRIDEGKGDGVSEQTALVRPPAWLPFCCSLSLSLMAIAAVRKARSAGGYGGPLACLTTSLRTGARSNACWR